MEIKRFAPILLRISLSLVFLWFSLNQFFFPEQFISYIPNFITNLTGLSAITIVLLNALFEFIFGMLLLTGLYVRTSAFLLGIHLIGITFSIGYNQIAIRDFGLALATLSVAMFGNDSWCLDKKEEF